jgi:hypothetical protein
LVKDIYESDQRARVSDPILVARVYSFYLGEEYKIITLREFLHKIYKHVIPAPDTITRAGRKVRELYPELGGGKKAKERREAERKITLDDLGYTPKKRSEDPQQLKLF